MIFQKNGAILGIKDLECSDIVRLQQLCQYRSGACQRNWPDWGLGRGRSTAQCTKYTYITLEFNLKSKMNAFWQNAHIDHSVSPQIQCKFRYECFYVLMITAYTLWLCFSECIVDEGSSTDYWDVVTADKYTNLHLLFFNVGKTGHIRCFI